MKTLRTLFCFNRANFYSWPVLACAVILGQASTRCQAAGTVSAWGANDALQSQVPPNLVNVVAVAGGESHSLALSAGGSVTAWGFNQSGQATVPLNVTNAIAISAGQSASLALNADGTVSVWGAMAPAPAGLSNVIAISGGYTHSLALKSDGTVVAWGSVSNVPSGLTNVVAIAAGNGQSLALCSDTTMVAWGDNSYGKAVVPAGLSNVVAIAAGKDHCLALRLNGTITAWGRNDNGQTSIPAGITNAVAIGGGATHSVAMRADGSLIAWGDDTYSQVSGTPTTNGFVALTAGGYHNLAVKGDGSPTIVQQPLSQTVRISRNVSFQVAAVGTPTLRYQWWHGGTRISGATTNVLTLTNVQLTDGGTYTVVVTNTLGAVTSAPAMLNAYGVPPVVTLAPQNTNTICGEAASFQVAVDGSAPFTYQWQFNSTPIAGATKTSLVLTNVDTTKAGSYTVLVTNAFGSVSTGAALTVTVVTPTITSSLTVTGTQGAAFSYSITGQHNPTSFGAIYLPFGLTLNPTTGVISGTPQEYGAFGPQISAANACSSDTKTLVINIAPSLPAITSPATSSGTENQPLSYQITATHSPTTFGALNLPSGLTVNPTSGIISGSPQFAGQYSSTIWASNSWGGATATLQFSISNAAITGLSMTNYLATYSSPYLVDISFTLRNNNDPLAGQSIYTDPRLLSVTCYEDGVPISPSETGDWLVRATTKLLKAYLVLDFSDSIASLSNGDSNGDGVSDAVDAEVNGAITFVNQQTSDTRLGVYEFHRDDKPPSQVISLSTDKTAVNNAIAGIWTNYVKNFPAGSVCWDALTAAISALGGTNADEEHYVVFVSDGRDESSVSTVQSVITAATNNLVRIYCIGFGDELNPAPLQQITSATGGQYYEARTTADLANAFTPVSKDIKGRYVLRWASLKRSSSIPVMPSFKITYQGYDFTSPTNAMITPASTNVDKTTTPPTTNITLAVTNYTIPPFVPGSIAGDVLMGGLRLAPNADIMPTALDLRATYIPRYIRQIRLHYVANWPCHTVLQSTNVGELLYGWTLSETNDGSGGKWMTLSSSNINNIATSLPFGSFGNLVTFVFRDAIPDTSTAFTTFQIDSSIYNGTGGQNFSIADVSKYIHSYTQQPLGTPMPWLAYYKQTSETADPDNDGVPNWKEYIANTNPTNATSAFAVRSFTRQADGRFQVTFNTSANRLYRVQSSTDLVTWQTVQENIPGINANVTVTDTRYFVNLAQIYYRVQVY